MRPPLQGRTQPSHTSLWIVLLVALWLLGNSAGCSITRRATWHAPHVAKPQAAGDRATSSLAESAYADALLREAAGDATCVDLYFQAAAHSWADLEPQPRACDTVCSRSGEIYRSSLVKLIAAGHRFGRLDPRRGITVQYGPGWLTVPTSYHGFPWQPDDFDHLVPVGEYATKELNHSYRSDGLGVSAVAIHCRRPHEQFRQPQQAFAATVILRPSGSVHMASAGAFVLELHDPLRISSVQVAGNDVPLARDLTAPIVYLLKDEGQDYLNGFLRPGSTSSNTGLFMIEPYQPGKIPLVFVHGLLSDRFTWANMANEIRARPDLSRYQIWGFEYATGAPFVLSAAALRRQLLQAQLEIDPEGKDPGLSQTILVGHSMGGLVSRLQVSYSGNQVWNSVSSRPLDSIVTTPAWRARLAEAFYFEPVPMISRVVFMATPHRGSPWANRPVGRLGAALVSEPSSLEQEHAHLIRDNPHTFSPQFTRRIPNSIDLLRPDDPQLAAINCLAIAPRVKLHSIVASGYWMVGAGDSDTVVPVASARIPGVVSERLIYAKHSQIHRNTAGVEELLRILRSHLFVNAQPQP